MKSFAYLPIHHKLHETPLKQDKHVDTVQCESFVYTLCLNRAIQEHFHTYFFIICIRREFKAGWVGGQAFTLHELKYSRGLELRKGHYIIFINITSLHAREIDETSKWGCPSLRGRSLLP